jgi:hypothetical protein
MYVNIGTRIWSGRECTLKEVASGVFPDDAEHLYMVERDVDGANCAPWCTGPGGELGVALPVEDMNMTAMAKTGE